MKKEDVIQEILDSYKSKIILNAQHIALAWWMTLPLEQQVKFGYTYFEEVSFNLTVRQISFIYDNQIIKK